MMSHYWKFAVNCATDCRSKVFFKLEICKIMAEMSALKCLFQLCQLQALHALKFNFKLCTRKGLFHATEG